MHIANDLLHPRRGVYAPLRPIAPLLYKKRQEIRELVHLKLIRWILSTSVICATRPVWVLCRDMREDREVTCTGRG